MSSPSLSMPRTEAPARFRSGPPRNLPVKEIDERTANALEHPGRIAGRAAEHSFHVFENEVLIRVFVVHSLIVTRPFVLNPRRIIDVRIHLHLLHVPALIHSFDATYAAVAGANMNRSHGPVASIGQIDDPDRITAIVSPERITP